MDFDYYSGKDLTYPARLQRPTLAPKHTSKDARDYADAMEHFESALVNHHAEISDYNTKSRARRSELLETLRSLYDLNEKQFDLLWNKAWEEGHSEGLQRMIDLLNEYNELVDQFFRLED